MKKRSLALVLAIAVAAVTGALAGEKTKADSTKPAKTTVSKKAKKSQAPASDKVLLTGSYIKQDIPRNGQITAGPNQLYVIDSKTIQNSGAADLRQLLVRQGQFR